MLKRESLFGYLIKFRANASYQDIETLVHQRIVLDEPVLDHWVACMDNSPQPFDIRLGRVEFSFVSVPIFFSI